MQRSTCQVHVIYSSVLPTSLSTNSHTKTYPFSSLCASSIARARTSSDDLTPCQTPSQPVCALSSRKDVRLRRLAHTHVTSMRYASVGSSLRTMYRRYLPPVFVSASSRLPKWEIMTVSEKRLMKHGGSLP